MIKVVLDANILVSALISGKASPAKIIKVWQAGKIRLIISTEILEELKIVLERLHIKKKYHLTDLDIKDFLKILWQYGVLAQPKFKLKIVKEDPADNKFIETAVEAKADYIISGDKHLLDLKEYNGVKIITAKKLIEIIE